MVSAMHFITKSTQGMAIALICYSVACFRFKRNYDWLSCFVLNNTNFPRSPIDPVKCEPYDVTGSQAALHSQNHHTVNLPESSPQVVILSVQPASLKNSITMSFLW